MVHLCGLQPHNTTLFATNGRRIILTTHRYAIARYYLLHYSHHVLDYSTGSEISIHYSLTILHLPLCLKPAYSAIMAAISRGGAHMGENKGWLCDLWVVVVVTGAPFCS